MPIVQIAFDAARSYVPNPTRRSGRQAYALQVVMKDYFKRYPWLFLAKKGSSCIPGWSLDPTLMSNQAKLLGPQSRLLALRFLCAAWSTSARMHSKEISPCPFCGKPASDHFPHIIGCSHFSVPMLAVLNQSPADYDLLRCAVATEVYQQVKHSSASVSVHALAVAALCKHSPSGRQALQAFFGQRCQMASSHASHIVAA